MKQELLDLLNQAVQIVEDYEEPAPPVPEPEPIPEPVPEPVVEDSVRYGIIKTEIIENGLTLNGKYTPAVSRMNDRPIPDDKKGDNIKITESQPDFVRSINNEKGAHYVNDTVHAMIINTPGKAESISSQHNFVSWEKGTDQNGCHKLRCFQGDDRFRDFIGRVDFELRPDAIFKCMAINLEGEFAKVGNAIDAYAPLMAKPKSDGGSGELWKNADSIEEFPALPVSVTVTAAPSLRVRKSYTMDSEVVHSLSTGETVNLYEYRPRGTAVWARTEKGWICLLLNGFYLTNWMLATPTVF